MNWTKVEDKLPEFYTEVLVYYSDIDGSNKDIMVASLQPKSYYDNDGHYWLEGDCIKGEPYSEEESIVKAWFPYQNYLNYPKL